jgi:hypothetical protein
MNSGAYVLLVLAAGAAFIAVAAIFLLRLVIRKLGIKELVDEGIVLTENGIEFPRFFFISRARVGYDEIESVELVPFPNKLFLRFKYGPSVSSMPSAAWSGFFRDTVVIKFKSPHFIQYRLFTPSKPEVLVEKLRSKITIHDAFKAAPSTFR